jgi:hypothetical protein
VNIPNIKAVSPVSGLPNIAALAQYTNTDERETLTMEQFLAFLYANPEQNKGPAVCISSEDWQRNETALAELCVKGNCTYEQKKTLERLQAFRQEVQNLNNVLQ